MPLDIGPEFAYNAVCCWTQRGKEKNDGIEEIKQALEEAEEA